METNRNNVVKTFGFKLDEGNIIVREYYEKEC